MRLLPLIALATACGGSIPQTIENTQFNPLLKVDLAHSTKLPGGMYYRDFDVGTGPAVAAGQTLKVYYIGSFPNGTGFDGRINPDPPFEFQLGDPRFITGWNEGLIGANVGANRQLIIPPSLAYGPNDFNGIPGNSILVFNVVIVSAQ